MDKTKMNHFNNVVEILPPKKALRYMQFKLYKPKREIHHARKRINNEPGRPHMRKYNFQEKPKHMPKRKPPIERRRK